MSLEKIWHPVCLRYTVCNDTTGKNVEIFGFLYVSNPAVLHKNLQGCCYFFLCNVDNMLAVVPAQTGMLPGANASQQPVQKFLRGLANRGAMPPIRLLPGRPPADSHFLWSRPPFPLPSPEKLSQKSHVQYCAYGSCLPLADKANFDSFRMVALSGPSETDRRFCFLSAGQRVPDSSEEWKFFSTQKKAFLDSLPLLVCIPPA